MGIQFEIHYNENRHGMYFTGQVVMGQAVIILEEPIPVKSVYLKVRGYSEVRWEESQSSKNGKSTRTYSDSEEYFRTRTECIETKGQEYILEPGTHTFTFECPLPLQCPTSFEGSYGRIRYETKITIVRPRKFNKSYSLGFSVLKIFDLNHLPDLRIPAKMEISKNFCCGPCKSRPLIISMDVARTAYVPGEFIYVNIRLVNNSSTKVEQVRMALNLIAFHSVSSCDTTKTEKITIAKCKFGGFEGSILDLRDKMQVPPTPPTCVDLCRIIKISYEVEVTARVKGAHISPVVSIPVIIGNVPYASGPGYYYGENSSTLGSHRDLSSELAPPSYEEALFGKHSHPRVEQDDENADSKSASFTPRYPFYGAQAASINTPENLG